MITTAAQESKTKDENSYRKVQNVVTDCTASLTGQSRASNLRSGKKMPEKSPGARRGGGDVKIVSELGQERFQAQLSSTQMGNPGSRFLQNKALGIGGKRLYVCSEGIKR